MTGEEVSLLQLNSKGGLKRCLSGANQSRILLRKGWWYNYYNDVAKDLKSFLMKPTFKYNFGKKKKNLIYSSWKKHIDVRISFPNNTLALSL